MRDVFLQIYVGLLGLCVFFMPLNSYAQRCDVDVEAIFKLRTADIGAYAVWDGIHGEKNREELYVGGALTDNGHVIVSGTRAALGKPNPELVVAEIDRRGRIVWETKRIVKGLDKVLGIVRFGDDYIVTARTTDKRKAGAIWLGFVDARGALRREQVFRHGQRSFTHANVVPHKGGKGLIMVASLEGEQSASSRFSEFYWLNSKGQVISKRAFNPGPDNGLYNIVQSEDGNYLAAGYINNALARKTGWLLKVDETGNILWQRQYPRGIGSELVHAAEMDNGNIVAFGTALPAMEDALKAGWLLMLDPSNGNMQWERYFTSNHDYTGKDVVTNKDGLISVLLDAKPVAGSFDEEGVVAKDYVRIVTLNPRGVIFDSQAYFQGEIADGEDLLVSPAGERIIIGKTQIAYQKETLELSGDDAKVMAEKPIESRSYEGWIVATPRADSYVDPCKPKKERKLKTL